MIMQSSIENSVSTPAGKASLFQRSRLAAAIGITSLMLVAGMSGSAFAAKGGIPGKPGDGGGMSPPDYGDLIIIERDDSGVPVLDANSCWKPIAFNSDSCELADGDIVPVDPETCGVQQPACTREVDFGRVNEARSPAAVFESQLEDVLVNLATADCVSLDPAGRLVATRVDSDLSVLVSTVDSPLQNLAIYRQLMLSGTIGTPLPGGDTLTSAARGLGAASDKAGEVNVDLIAYLNQIMGLSDPGTPTILPKICIQQKEEVAGTVQLVQKCFLNYGMVPPDATAYDYQRSANFGGLPAPAYIPAGNPQEGTLEYLEDLGTTPPTFGIAYDLTTHAVFDNQPGYILGNIGGFAQAADDTRSVIEFMHTNQVPVEYETAVPCTDSGDDTYDVSISDVSGLQVPKQIVDGSEGREFSVTVANAGPDAATGTVTVTATAGNAVAIEGSPWTFDIENLSGGASTSYTELFVINLGEKTTISWTATVFAPDDVNPGNNTVTETSSVKVTGSGGGGGGGQGGPASASSNGKSGK